MSARAILGIVVALPIVACGRIDEPLVDTGTQTSAVAQGNDEGEPAAPSSPDAGRPPPPSCGNDGGGGTCPCAAPLVCCSAPEPCAGRCVPDCRFDPSKCPTGATCSATSGVCEFGDAGPPPGPPPPPPR